MTEYRTFQRYSLRQIPHTVGLVETDNLKVENLSLSGIGLSGPVGFSPKKVSKIELRVADKKFDLYLNLIWAEKVYTPSGMKVCSGYRIVFNNTEKFRLWLTFVRALDKIYWKKIATRKSSGAKRRTEQEMGK